MISGKVLPISLVKTSERFWFSNAITMSCCTNSSLAKSKSDDSNESKDSGGTKWWTICAASFLIQFVVLGMQNCSGIVFAKLIEEYKATRGATGKNVEFTLPEKNSTKYKITKIYFNRKAGEVDSGKCTLTALNLN